MTDNIAITQTKETQAQLSPQQALDMLKEGNARFVNSAPLERNLNEQVHQTGTNGQAPFAVVLGCIDSRVPAELVFDQGIGDIFNIRIAGNFVNDDILGSMEFSCKLAGSKVILVLGHTKCGAIKGAVADAKLGNLTGMLDKLKPAVEAAKAEHGNVDDAFHRLVEEKNVKLTIEQIKSRSAVLKEMLDNGEIALVGGIYDVETGEVSYLN